MRKVAITAALALASCSGRGEVIPTPSPEPQTPTTVAEELIAAPVTTELEPEPTTTVPPSTTVAPEPILCPALNHPAHHAPCPKQTSTATTTAATSRSSSSVPPEYIKQCESGGNYQAVNPNGHYGAWQFSQSTWNSVGGTGRPDHAAPAEQDYRASILWDNGNGAGHWECA